MWEGTWNASYFRNSVEQKYRLINSQCKSCGMTHHSQNMLTAANNEIIRPNTFNLSQTPCGNVSVYNGKCMFQNAVTRWFVFWNIVTSDCSFCHLALYISSFVPVRQHLKFRSENRSEKYINMVRKQSSIAFIIFPVKTYIAYNLAGYRSLMAQ